MKQEHDGKHEHTINLQKLHTHWFTKYADIMNGVPLELLPLREINHRIPLIEENKKYHYHLPCCPGAMKPQLMRRCEATLTWDGGF